MIIVGLDASTKTIGFCVLEIIDSKINLRHLEHFSPPKKGNIFERLNKVREYIFDKLEQFKPDKVILEDVVLFMAGRSTAKTITSLAILNRTVGLAVMNKMGEAPELLNVMSIRHSIKKNKKLPAKEEIPELVAEILDIDFPWVYNKKGQVAPESYDQADSIAVALAWIKKNYKF